MPLVEAIQLDKGLIEVLDNAESPVGLSAAIFWIATRIKTHSDWIQSIFVIESKKSGNKQKLLVSLATALILGPEEDLSIHSSQRLARGKL